MHTPAPVLADDTEPVSIFLVCVRKLGQMKKSLQMQGKGNKLHANSTLARNHVQDPSDPPKTSSQPFIY